MCIVKIRYLICINKPISFSLKIPTSICNIKTIIPIQWFVFSSSSSSSIIHETHIFDVLARLQWCMFIKEVNCIRYPTTKCFIYCLGITSSCDHEKVLVSNDLTACVVQVSSGQRIIAHWMPSWGPPYESIEPIRIRFPFEEPASPSNNPGPTPTARKP